MFGSFSNEMKSCAHCGMWHQGVCPRIKSIEYYPNGMIKKIIYQNLNFESDDVEGVPEDYEIGW